MSFANGGFGKTLPLTGPTLVVAGTAVPAPKLAAIAAVVIVAGFLLLRFARPAKVGDITPGRPGKAKVRVWRRGRL